MLLSCRPNRGPPQPSEGVANQLSLIWHAWIKWFILREQALLPITHLWALCIYKYKIIIHLFVHLFIYLFMYTNLTSLKKTIIVLSLFTFRSQPPGVFVVNFLELKGSKRFRITFRKFRQWWSDVTWWGKSTWQLVSPFSFSSPFGGFNDHVWLFNTHCIPIALNQLSSQSLFLRFPIFGITSWLWLT